LNTLRLLWDRLALYVPVMLMGVMAMGTYWLVRNTPIVGPEATAPVAGHEPDYFMHQFAVRTFDDKGHLKSEVKGVQARHFPDTNTLEIDQVHIRSFNAEGHLTKATARQAISNGDGSEVQLIGAAKVTRDAVTDSAGQLQPSMTFTGEFLHAFMNSERIKSHLPVELTRGKDRFTADSMEFDNLDRVMLLKGRVRGMLQPGVAP